MPDLIRCKFFAIACCFAVGCATYFGLNTKTVENDHRPVRDLDRIPDHFPKQSPKTKSNTNTAELKSSI